MSYVFFFILFCRSDLKNVRVYQVLFFRREKQGLVTNMERNEKKLIMLKVRQYISL